MKIDFQKELLMADARRKEADRIAALAVEQFALKVNDARKQDAEKFLDEVKTACTNAPVDQREHVVTGLLLEKLMSLGYREATQFCKEVVWRTL